MESGALACLVHSLIMHVTLELDDILYLKVNDEFVKVYKTFRFSILNF